jgi:hypothetical protein
MPPSERVLEKLKRVVIFTDEPENPIQIEEFDDIENVKEWNKIEELTFKNIHSLKELPSLPNNLKKLTLDNTGILALPTLPKSLHYLDLTENTSLIPPDKLSKGLTSVTLSDNNFKIIPDMKPMNIKKLIIKEEALEEPFIGVYNQYEIAKNSQYEQATRVFFINLSAIWERINIKRKKENIKSKARNLKSIKLALSKSNKSTNNIDKLIASYISGKSEKIPINKQISELYGDYLWANEESEGGRRNKTRKHKRGSRKH